MGLSVECSSCHLSGSQNFVFAPKQLENFATLVLIINTVMNYTIFFCVYIQVLEKIQETYDSVVNRFERMRNILVF